ncbi:MAG: hypothetical protein ACYTKD_03080 [Planctomycetota bacterium]
MSDLDLALRIRGWPMPRCEIIRVEDRAVLWRGKAGRLRGLWRSWETPLHALDGPEPRRVGGARVERRRLSFRVSVADVSGRAVVSFLTGILGWPPLEIEAVRDGWRLERIAREEPGNELGLIRRRPYTVGGWRICRGEDVVAEIWRTFGLPIRTHWQIGGRNACCRIAVRGSADADTVALFALGLSWDFPDDP